MPDATDRRTFLMATLSMLLATQRRRLPLDSLTDWLALAPGARAAALPDLLARIARLEPAIHAWVQVAPERPTGQGSLADIPFGAKDVMETAGLATEYGSPVYHGRIGTTDAAIVRMLRDRGAVLVGKTQCTGFAWRTPGPTRNPRQLEHTPGGSSSGSAAAVAAGMVPLALGTQTLGSVLRPASYCGVTGFKPTYGLIPTEGVLPLAGSLDTVGFFTRTAADMLGFWQAFGRPVPTAGDVVYGVPQQLPPVEPSMLAAFHAAVDRIKAAGAEVRTVDMRDLLPRLAEATLAVCTFEAARVHEARFREFGARLDAVAELVTRGLAMPREEYDRARQYSATSREQVGQLHHTTPVILVPAATGPAPLGLSFTGDASMNSPWTALGTPAITIPMPVGAALPLGLQLTATQGADAVLLHAAVHVERMLGMGS